MTVKADSLRTLLRDTARSLCEGALELAWPTRCAGCDMPGVLLCDECRSRLRTIDPESACPLCGAPYGSTICTECWDAEGPISHRFSSAACALEFDDIAAKVVVAFKDGGELRLANVIAELMARAIADAGMGGFGALVAIPASPAARLRRGYDHMDLVAGPLAKRLGVDHRRLLVARDVADQRGLGRSQRGENMQDAFAVAAVGAADGPLPRRVLLVDDVLTTGATLDAAAGALLAAGVEEVVAATACRVW